VPATRSPDDPDAAGDDVDERRAPSTDVEVEVHVPFGMTGSFPLRVAELFFADNGFYVTEYSYITPFIGLTAGKHRREASAMQRVYDRYGLDAVLFQADSVVWHSYGNLDRLVVYDGGWLGRPKIAVYPETGPSHAYRFHNRTGYEEAVTDLEACADRHGFTIEWRDGLGFTPKKSVRRFFWRPDE
jgi:hypothetical protein